MYKDLRAPYFEHFIIFQTLVYKVKLLWECIVFCAQAQKQVDKSEIYLAISSFNFLISTESRDDHQMTVESTPWSPIQATFTTFDSPP